MFYLELICSRSLMQRSKYPKCLSKLCLWTLRLFGLWWWLVFLWVHCNLCFMCTVYFLYYLPLGFGTSSGFGCGTTGASTFGFGTTDKPSGSLSAGLCASAWTPGRWRVKSFTWTLHPLLLSVALRTLTHGSSLEAWIVCLATLCSLTVLAVCTETFWLKNS